MRKKGLGLIFLLALTVLVTSYGLLVTDLFAEEETYTITTYYPSPYGSYNELQVYRSVTYKPVNKDTLTNPKEGELVYNGSDDTFYYYNGQTWTAQGGQGGYFLQCGNCPSGTTRIGSAQYGTGIGGIVATSGYSSSTLSGYISGIGYYCTCYCASSLWIGGQTMACGQRTECLKKTYDAPSSTECDNYCKSMAPQMPVTGISICK